jgi:coniferyl-aldehyde dehydrogenase
MEAAARNLTPVTLELGGKSPAIVHSSYSLAKAAARIAWGKTYNAGQTCIAPDYVLVPTGQESAFADAAEAWIRKAFPTLLQNKDYTSIIHPGHHKRLLGLIEDARAKGATIREVNPAGESFSLGSGKLAPTLVLGATEDMDILSEEIFGPVLPVLGVPDLDAAIAYVNDRPRPLALYYFDHSNKRQGQVLNSTVSGGACVNDVLLHNTQEELPFGGVGPSGVGAYHGRTGFLTFSHAKSVFVQSRLAGNALLDPPYGGLIENVSKLFVGR